MYNQNEDSMVPVIADDAKINLLKIFYSEDCALFELIVISSIFLLTKL